MTYENFQNCKKNYQNINNDKKSSSKRVAIIIKIWKSIRHIPRRIFSCFLQLILRMGGDFRKLSTHKSMYFSTNISFIHRNLRVKTNASTLCGICKINA